MRIILLICLSLAIANVHGDGLNDCEGSLATPEPLWQRILDRTGWSLPAAMPAFIWEAWQHRTFARRLNFSMGRQTAFVPVTIPKWYDTRERLTIGPLQTAFKSLELELAPLAKPEFSQLIAWFHLVGVRHFVLDYIYTLEEIEAAVPPRKALKVVNESIGLRQVMDKGLHKLSKDTLFIPVSVLSSDATLLSYLESQKAKISFQNEVRLQVYQQETREILSRAFTEFGARTGSMSPDGFPGSAFAGAIELVPRTDWREAAHAEHEVVHIANEHELKVEQSSKNVARMIKFTAKEGTSFPPAGSYGKAFRFDEVEAYAKIAEFAKDHDLEEAWTWTNCAIVFVEAEAALMRLGFDEIIGGMPEVATQPAAFGLPPMLILRLPVGTLSIDLPYEGLGDKTPAAYIHQILWVRFKFLRGIDKDLSERAYSLRARMRTGP